MTQNEKRLAWYPGWIIALVGGWNGWFVREAWRDGAYGVAFDDEWLDAMSAIDRDRARDLRS